MGNQNRKATREEMRRFRRVVQEAFPNLEAVFGSHSAYGGHRAPRVRTIAFRLRDSRGKYRSNVVWVMPDDLASATADDVRRMVDSSNGLL